MDSDNSNKFNEALSTFYKLKKQYKDQSDKFISKVRVNSNLTAKEKHDAFRQLNTTIKCVNCGKIGGSIFKQYDNILSVTCGHKEKPCKLNIKLQKTKYVNINEQITDLNNKININKTETIRSKLNFLFGYKSESYTLETFNKLKMELIEEVKKYQVLNERYLNVVSNLSVEKQLSEDNNTLITLVQKIKSLIKSYEDSNDIGFLKEVTDLYINNIDETVKNIQSLKYNNNDLNYDDKDKTYNLIQQPFTLDQLQIPIDKTPNKIISFTK